MTVFSRRAPGAAATTGLAVALIAALPLLALSYSSGAPSGFAFPEQNCSVCHGVFGETNTGTGSIAISAPTSYAPGTPVPITITIVNTTVPGPDTRQGFEVSVRDAATNTFVGSFDLGGSPDVQFAQGNVEYVTHTAGSNMDDTWTFAWVPPTADPPAQVILYAAGNAADGDGEPDEDDFVYTATHTLTATVSSEEGPAASTRLEAIAPQPLATNGRGTLVLGRAGSVVVALVDGRGRTVRTLIRGTRAAGSYPLAVEASGLAPGTYFLVADTPEGRRTRPVVIAR